MQCFADVKSNVIFGLSIFTLVISFAVGIFIAPSTYAQSLDSGSVVGVTVCTDSSQISLMQPVSDSVVTEPSVPLVGTVEQAGQIEIKIDGAFDSIIPLSIGQTSFTGSVQLTPGTHTIQLTAISVCPGDSGKATAVVTYTPPPQTPSFGDDTPTTVEGKTTPSAESLGDKPIEGGFDLGKQFPALPGIARWLNIDFGEDGGDGIDRLSVGQALVLTVGAYLVVIGIAPVLLPRIATIPLVAQVLPSLSLPGRIRFLAIGSRIFGGLLILWTILFS